MSDCLRDRGLSDFSKDLAARTPVPGGGGASAYVGALGAALASMAGAFTDDRGVAGCEGGAGCERRLADILREADEARVTLVGLVDEDAAAFLGLSRAYKLDRAEPGRAEAIEAATRRATEVPLEIMRKTCRVVELSEELERIANPRLISDVGCAALLAASAIEAASLSVLINTSSMADRTRAEAVEGECDHMVEEYVTRARDVARRVSDRVRGR
ncbi:MAG: cyclodeaminase/cyclohydrolase family protein [Olsenella sp.]|nr:cyclodeaminase/cyclohydrolase family protein [Olsenella sp.]